MTPHQIIQLKYARIFEALPDELSTFEAIGILQEQERKELLRLQNKKA
jgi:hypothetical protein